jgi:hypothetical protein
VLFRSERGDSGDLTHSASTNLQVDAIVSANCNNNWYNIPQTSYALKSNTNPVTVYIPSNSASNYKNSIGVAIIGNNNLIYHQNCIFGLGSPCAWLNDWQMVPGDITGGGGSIYSYTLTNINTLIYGVNQLWKLLVQYSSGNFATVNWSSSGWNPWYTEFGSPSYGTPTSTTANNYTFEFRRNPSYPYNAQYRCFFNTYSLNVQVQGSGTVTSNPAGINCGQSLVLVQIDVLLILLILIVVKMVLNLKEFVNFKK